MENRDIAETLRRLQAEIAAIRQRLQDEVHQLEAEVVRLRAERDAVIKLCLDHDLSGSNWWIRDPITRGADFFGSEAAAVAAIRAAAGLGEEKGEAL